MANQEKQEAERAAPVVHASAGRHRGGTAKITVKVEFDLDDSSIFNLNKGGIKVVAVTEN